jgi:hypothetical protein
VSKPIIEPKPKKSKKEEVKKETPEKPKKATPTKLTKEAEAMAALATSESMIVMSPAEMKTKRYLP